MFIILVISCCLSRFNFDPDKNLHPDNPDPEDSMTVTVIAAGAIGSVLLIVVVGVLIKLYVH